MVVTRIAVGVARVGVTAHPASAVRRHHGIATGVAVRCHRHASPMA
jgi:hypothetical protein